MKALLVSLAMAFFSLNAYSSDLDNFIPDDIVYGVSNVSYEYKSGELFVDIAYSGGCEEHDFKLDIVDCFQGDVLICKANVVRIKGQNDHCKEYVRDMVIFPMRGMFEQDVVELNIAGHSVLVEDYSR